MEDLKQALVLVGFCSLSAACMATTSDEPGDGDEAVIGSVQLALTSPEIVRVVSPIQDVELACPAGNTFALSVWGGEYPSSGNDDINKIYFESNDGDPVGVHMERTFGDAPTLLGAVCSDYNAPYKISSYDGDGDKIASCPANYVAVGGGGVCSNSGARLTRSRPSPDTAGAKPTGWRATCSTGGVTTSVNCAYTGGSFWDWNGCKVRKTVETNWGVVGTSCNSGELAVAAGAYCGDGGYLSTLWMSSSMSSTEAACSQDRVTAYAVCCPGVVEG